MARGAPTSGDLLLRPTAAILLILACSSAGCALRNGSAKNTPSQPAPSGAPPAPPARVPHGPLSTPQTQVRLPPPQPIPEGAAPEPAPVAVESRPPEQPPAVRPRPERPVEVAQPAPQPAPPPPAQAETPAPPPQLGPILSTSQRQAYNREIDQSILATRRLLDIVTSRQLSFDQSAEVRRIRAFLSQAAETREQDVAQARNLAQRARVLADDLERSTR